MGKECNGRHEGAVDGAHQVEVVPWVNAELPLSCGAGRATDRAAGVLRQTRQIQCVKGVVRSFLAQNPTHAAQCRLDKIEVDAGKVCFGLRRVSIFNVNAAALQRLSSTIAPATACSFAGLEVAMWGNLWGDRDEWRLRRAHAPPWPVAPVREIARRSIAERRPGSWLMQAQHLRGSGRFGRGGRPSVLAPAALCRGCAMGSGSNGVRVGIISSVL